MKSAIATVALLIAAAITSDLFAPWARDLRHFDPRAVGRLEAEMWRAYYERRPLRLYLNLVALLRAQEGFPPLRAHLAAYRAARAALTFKEGHRREEYERALPDLEGYFAAVCQIGKRKVSPRHLAELELEWWIVHRDEGPAHPRKLADAIAAAAAELYGERPEALLAYADLRAQAMLTRDEVAYGRGMLEDDWRELAARLGVAYEALAETLHSGRLL